MVQKYTVFWAVKNLVTHLILCLRLFIPTFTPGLLRFLDHVLGLLESLETRTQLHSVGTEIVFVSSLGPLIYHYIFSRSPMFLWMTDSTTNSVLFFFHSLHFHPSHFPAWLWLQPPILIAALFPPSLTSDLYNLPVSSCIKPMLALLLYLSSPTKSLLWLPTTSVVSWNSPQNSFWGQQFPFSTLRLLKGTVLSLYKWSRYLQHLHSIQPLRKWN